MQPHWLILEIDQFYDWDVNKLFARAGEYCNTYAGAHSDSCFNGIGFLVNRYSDSVANTEVLCQLAGGGPSDAGTNYCLHMSVFDYVMFEHYDEAAQVCERITLDALTCPEDLDSMLAVWE